MRRFSRILCKRPGSGLVIASLFIRLSSRSPNFLGLFESLHGIMIPWSVRLLHSVAILSAIIGSLVVCLLSFLLVLKAVPDNISKSVSVNMPRLRFSFSVRSRWLGYVDPE